MWIQLSWLHRTWRQGLHRLTTWNYASWTVYLSVIKYLALVFVRRGCNFELLIFKLILRINILNIAYKIAFGEWHETSLIISQHQFRQWLGAVRQQGITCTRVDRRCPTPFGVTRLQWVNSPVICKDRVLWINLLNSVFCFLPKKVYCIL